MPNISGKKALAGSSPPGGADPLAAVKQITKGESELIKAAIPALETLRSIRGSANPTALSAIGGASQYASILSQLTSLMSMLDSMAGRKKSSAPNTPKITLRAEFAEHSGKWVVMQVFPNGDTQATHYIFDTEEEANEFIRQFESSEIPVS